MKNQPKIFIIILNYKGFDDTKECLESLKRLTYSNYEIILVDNASEDGSVEKLKNQYPAITLIENKVNSGFTGGNNIGFEYISPLEGEYVFLLNNDTIVDPDILERFVEAYERLDNPGVLGGMVYLYSQPEKPAIVGGVWNSKNLTFDYYGSSSSDEEEECKTKSKELDFVIGCSIFFKKDLIKEIGMFEQDFFIDYEETDFCFRAAKVGYKCYHVPKARVWHKESVTFGGGHTPLHTYFLTRNKLLWMRRNIDNMSFNKYLKTVFLVFFPSVLYKYEKSILKKMYWDVRECLKKPYVRATMIIGVFDFMRGRFGHCPSLVRVMQSKHMARVSNEKEESLK